MILEFIKDTPTIRGNKQHKKGTTCGITNLEWGNEQVKKGNAILLDAPKKTFNEILEGEKIKRS